MTAWLHVTDRDGDTRSIGTGTYEWCEWTASHLDPSVEVMVVDRWITLSPDPTSHRFEVSLRP